jgi:hypothetical protein
VPKNGTFPGLAGVKQKLRVHTDWDVGMAAIKEDDGATAKARRAATERIIVGTETQKQKHLSVGLCV